MASTDSAAPARAQQHLETLESIKYVRGSLKLLDQRQIPFAKVFDDICTVEDIFVAIKEMRVRGAPAIAVSAALGIAVAAGHEAAANRGGVAESPAAAMAFLERSIDYVVTSRPTAVNLLNAMTALKARIAPFAATATTGASIVAKFTEFAEEDFAMDVAYNERIMRAGATFIAAALPPNAKANILTICNTGALATSRFGTALGVVRQLHYDGALERVYACETRPWNQGARLTVFECVEESIPVTLIVDSAVSALMASRRIDAVIVGADRVCENGDTANKIGTYNVAVAAAFHGVPFFVAAPVTTLDPATPNGAAVTIEERGTEEITHNMAARQRVVADGPTLSIWNPVFDITPARLITGGIITDLGVIRPGASPAFYSMAEVLKRPIGSQ